MKIILTLIFTIVLSSSTKPQKLISDYKKVADKSLLNYFNVAVIPKIKCNSFGTISQDKQTANSYFYSENRSKILSFSVINFSYTLFDTALNYNIDFVISVDKNFRIAHDSSILKSVPVCILTFQNCALISTDSAKQISISDSIKFNNDLTSQLEKNKLDKEYYWIITGHKPSDRPKKNKPSLELHSEFISSDQRRIINAKTGQIITSKEFDLDW